MNQIMILGTFHMKAQNDRVNFQGTDKIYEYEADIIDVVNALSKFNPTRIAVEHSKSQQGALDAAYSKYLAYGSQSPDEIDQLAFRLAKKLGHKKVNAVDWMEMGAVERGFGEVYEYLHSKQPELAKEIDALEEPAVDLERESLCDTFLQLNSKESVKNTLAYYMNYARVGTEDYYGNGWLIWWYQRNLNIFTNTAALANSEDKERILLIIGAAHKGILEQFFQNSMAFEVVDSLSYLKRN